MGWSSVISRITTSAMTIIVVASIAGCGSSSADGVPTDSSAAESTANSSPLAMSGECRLLDDSEVEALVGGGELTAAKTLSGGCRWEVDQGSAGVTVRKNESERGLATAREARNTVDLPGGTIYVRSLSDATTCIGTLVGDATPPNEFAELTVVAAGQADSSSKLPPGQTYCNVAAPGVQKLLEAMGWTK